MPTYEFWYDETYTRKAYFEAEDNVEARGLLEMVDKGELGPEDIDNVYFKDVSHEIGIDTGSLSRLDGEDV
jgi:hypothetical protein